MATRKKISKEEVKEVSEKVVPMQNYPKVCFGCSRPHIQGQHHEKLSADGTKAFHVDCAEKEPAKTEEVLETVDNLEVA